MNLHEVSFLYIFNLFLLRFTIIAAHDVFENEPNVRNELVSMKDVALLTHGELQRGRQEWQWQWKI
jgi:nitric oxide reductase large subunit